MSRIIKVLSSYAKKILTCLDKILPRSYQCVPRNFVYQDLGKMFQVLQKLTRSCMTWQGVSSFVTGYDYNSFHCTLIKMECKWSGDRSKGHLYSISRPSMRSIYLWSFLITYKFFCERKILALNMKSLYDPKSAFDSTY